jgi:hypothetical protein
LGCWRPSIFETGMSPVEGYGTCVLLTDKVFLICLSVAN